MSPRESENDSRSTEVEIGTTAGRTHTQVLEQNIGHARALDATLANGPPPPARGEVVRARHREAP